MDHPNVLVFLGYLLEDGVPSLISEWMENGTAFNYVKTHPNCNIALIVSQKLRCNPKCILTSDDHRHQGSLRDLHIFMIKELYTVI